MENNHENAPGSKQGFQYTYSAKEQEELKRIREKYASRENPDNQEGKMERLRRLDAEVTRKAQIVSMILGVVGCLILGMGMSLIMTDLGGILGTYEHLSMPLGILIGVVGGGITCIAYPMYQVILKRERKKIAPEILQLTDELLK